MMTKLACLQGKESHDHVQITSSCLMRIGKQEFSEEEKGNPNTNVITH